MRVTRFRRAAVVIGTALCLSAVAAPADAAVATQRESFERDMGGWRADTDGRARDWRIYRTTERAVDGTVGLGFYLDGRNDDGTIWIERTFPSRPSSTVTVSVSFWVHSTVVSEINAWPVVATVGVRDPEVERDLPIIGMTNRTLGWAKYSFTKSVSTDRTGTVWVAVGLSATWEGIRTHHVDLVETTITVP
jgi:hypothetical protein